MKKYILFGKESEYSTFTWWESFMSGHVTLKLPFKSNVTFYGENAMHWAINWYVNGIYVCFRLPFRCFGRWWPLYFYISNDATPSNAKFKIGIS